MDFNAIVAALATAWASITEVLLNLVGGFDWNSLVESISALFTA